MVKILRQKIKGFTLIELSIVLLIVSLLLAGILVPLREGVESERRASTQEQLKSMEQALYGFAIANGRLPCPDCRNAGLGNCNAAGVTINDGQEDLNGTSCALDPNAAPNDILEGNIPWVTLGIDQRDAWDNWFTYSVVDYAADVTGSGTPGNADVNCLVNAENLSTIDICTVGNLQVFNIANGCPLPPPAPLVQSQIAQNVFAVIVSHGANTIRNPANTGLIAAPLFCSEIENLDQDGTFIASDFIEPGPPGAVPGGNISLYGIDDMILWISPHILKGKLVQAERLP